MQKLLCFNFECNTKAVYYLKILMKFTKQEQNFISEIDQFLAKFDAEHPEPSPSQAAEIEKYARIFKLRDDATAKISKDLFDFENS